VLRCHSLAVDEFGVRRLLALKDVEFGDVSRSVKLLQSVESILLAVVKYHHSFIHRHPMVLLPRPTNVT